MAKAVARRKAPRMTIPLAVLAGFLPLAGVTMTSLKQGGPELAGYNLVSNLTGYDIPTKTWNWQYMQKGTIPIVAGILAHKLIGQKLGVNRILARAGVPLFRL
jgi:hypothetical protein